MEFIQLMELRLDFWVKWLTSLIIVLMNYFVWTTAFAAKQVYAGYTLESIVAYFIIASFLYNIILIHRQEIIGRDIVEGTLTVYLVKPLSYPWQILSRAMVSRVVYATIGAVMMYGISFFIIPFTVPTSTHILWGSIAVVIAVILYSCIDLLLGMTSFWLARSNGPRWLFATIIMLASGLTFPIDLLPSWLYHLLNMTPFPYLIYFPTSILAGHFDSTQVVHSAVVGLAWCMVLIFLTGASWRRGLRQFEGSGL